jgi:hypothetical protein
MPFKMSQIDEKKFINNYSKLRENIIRLYIEQRKIYKTYEAHIILMCVANRVGKYSTDAVKNSNCDSEVNLKIKKSIAHDHFKGVNISSIVRETEIPRTTVIRICNNFIKSKVLEKNEYGGIITGKNFRKFNEEGRLLVYNLLEAIKKKYE